MERLRPEEAFTSWFLWCHTCGKALYTPSEDNIVTRTEAVMAAQSHKNAFSDPHNVFIVDLKHKRTVGKQ